MRTRRVALAASALAATVAASEPVRAAAPLPALIPRVALFGNPAQTQPQISPDGARIAYLAPASGGSLSIWVRTAGKPDGRLIVPVGERALHSFLWQADSAHLLYAQDADGSRDRHVYQVDVAAKASRDVTPAGTSYASILAISDEQPSALLVAAYERDRAGVNVYRVDLRTGIASREVENPGKVSDFIADGSLHVRAARAVLPDGADAILARRDEAEGWREVVRFTLDDGLSALEGVSPDGGEVYAITAQGHNTSRLLRYDTLMRRARVMAADGEFDVRALLTDRKTRGPLAALVVGEHAEWRVLDPAWRADFELLRALAPGDFTITSMSRDSAKLVVSYNADERGVRYFLYDRARKRASFLFAERPNLESYRLAAMKPITYPARDGLTIRGYLTLPAGGETRNLPTVLLVHGGPWWRDEWGFDPTVQWLANRGYAVLQPNFRGSIGFGKTFLDAGNRQWAGNLLGDLLDGVSWAVAQGYADPKRIAIMGGSFGGYATLAGLAFSAQTFCAGIDRFGPSNLVTHLDELVPSGSLRRPEVVRQMGDDPRLLKRQSPVFAADRITAPVLIAHGANDSYVRQSQSDEIVAALRRNNRTVEYIVFPDEGHGFARPENNLRFSAAAEEFLGRYLGGRVEPPGPAESVTAYLR